MPGAGPRTRGSMPCGRRLLAQAVVVAALVAGCAQGAPPTITPARPVAPSDPVAGAPTAPTGPAPTGPVPTGPVAKAPVTTEDLVALGEDLTAALAGGDVEEWMALTTLTGEAAQQQRDWFAGVQAVPMEVREMHPTWLLERDVAGDVDGPRVEFSFRHQITGADVIPAVELYEFTLERAGTDGPYRVVEVSGSEEVDSSYPQLWDLGPIEVVETEHVVLITQPGGDLAELVGGMDEGAGAVLDAFPVEGVERMVTTLAGEDLVATLFHESEEGTYAGFAVPVLASPSVETGSGLPDLLTEDLIGARLVIDRQYAEDEWAAYGEPDGGSPVMRHEGLHLAMTLRHPDAFPPRWAVEGFAGWFEITGDPVVLEASEDWYAVLAGLDGLPDALPPSDYDEFFGGLGEEDEEDGDDMDEADRVELAYLEAANVFLYAEETYGTDATAALGNALHTHDLWWQDEADLSAIVQEQLGVDLVEFEQGYVDWVQDTYGG